MQNFKGSNPQGRKAEIRSTNSLDYRPQDLGFSVFTWRDVGTGVQLWSEKHELTWDDAFATAQNWLK